MVIADTIPMVASGLKMLLGGSHPGSIEISSCELALCDRLQRSDTPLLILDPAFVQSDIDLGDVELLFEFRKRFAALPILIYTTVTDPITLAKIASLEGVGVASKADDLAALLYIIEQLLHGNVALISPRIEALLREADNLI